MIAGMILGSLLFSAGAVLGGLFANSHGTRIGFEVAEEIEARAAVRRSER